MTEETAKEEGATAGGYDSLPDAVDGPEAFVRRALALLEADFREAALLALADWEQLGFISQELFDAVASMQRPSWGAWNGLLSALRSARKSALRTLGAEGREKVERAVVLNRLLALLEERVAPETAADLRPLGKITNPSETAQTTKVGQLLTLPITLRNRVAHDAPSGPEWWKSAAAALSPLISFVARKQLFDEMKGLSSFPSPWFLVEDGKAWAFNGLTNEFAAVYVSKDGASRVSIELGQEVLLAFQRLLGKQEAQAKDFRKLLGQLAPEEIRGVLMGDYLVGKPVGSGGFGTVHAGRQLSTGRKVAIKILHDGMDADARARFQQEASYLSKFDHPHIVRVIGYGEETWTAPRRFSLSEEEWFREFSRSSPIKYYIAMEWVEGRTLEEIYHSPPETKPAPGLLAEWFAQAANALAAVHASGLIHRDVKPNNIMVTADGTVKLMDFGIARTQDETRTLLTVAGQAFGTPAYMSPEQARAGIDAEAEVGPATDIYSLCATFYELFTGARLFRHNELNAEQVKALKLSGLPPSPPRQHAKSLAWELETILLGGLQAEVSDRYRTASALERDIRRYLRDESILYQRPSVFRRLQLGYRRNRAVSNIVAAFLLVSVAGVSLFIYNIRQEQARTLRQLLALYQEQGRQELLKGNPHLAAIYLSEAYREGYATDELRFLLGQAMRPVNAQVATLEGHTDGVVSVAFSPDSSRIVTGGRDKTARVWDAVSGQMLMTLEGYEYPVTTVFFRQDGQRLITADQYGKARFWDAASGNLLAAPKTQYIGEILSPYSFSPDGRLLAAGGIQHAGIWEAENSKELAALKESGSYITLAAFSPDANLVVTTVGNSGTYIKTSVQLWEAATGALLATLDDHKDYVTSAVFSPDSKLLVTTGAENDRTAKVWDMASKTVLVTLTGHGGKVTSAVFSPDGRLIATTGEDNTARVWDIVEKKSLFVLRGHVDDVTSARFSPDGRLLATVGAVNDRTVKIWDAEHGQPLLSLAGHAGVVEVVAFSPDSRRLATASADGTTKVWDVSKERLPISLAGHRDVITFAGYSADGKLVLTTGGDGTARIWDAANGKELFKWEEEKANLNSATFSPDGRRLLVASSDKLIALWEMPSGQQLLNFECPADIEEAVFSPDSQRILVTYADTKFDLLQIREAATGKLLTTLKREEQPASGDPLLRAAIYSPDGQLITARDTRKTLIVWDASSGKVLATIGNRRNEEDGDLSNSTFSPDGKLLVTTSEKGKVKIWEAESGKLVRSLEGHLLDVDVASFSPDGKLLLTAGDDRTARVWEVSSGKLIFSLEGHREGVYLAAFSPDGRLLATGSYDRTVKIWETESGKLLSSLEGHTDVVRAVEFSPDGRNLLTASNDRTAKIWDVHLESRSPTEIAEAIRRSVPFRLEQGRLVPNTPRQPANK